MVECDLAKVEVAGSNPVSRSIELFRALPGEGILLFGRNGADAIDILGIWRYLRFQGAVPKW